MEVGFKILFTIGGFYTHDESLSNHTTFRPI